MGQIAKFLTDYVIAKGTVKEDERGMYEYGFLITLEKILCLITCFVISIVLNTISESMSFSLAFSLLKKHITY